MDKIDDVLICWQRTVNTPKRLSVKPNYTKGVSPIYSKYRVVSDFKLLLHLLITFFIINMKIIYIQEVLMMSSFFEKAQQFGKSFMLP